MLISPNGIDVGRCVIITNNSINIKKATGISSIDKVILILPNYANSNKRLLTTLHLFNGLFSRTTWVTHHQKGKPFWVFMKQEMMGRQWHQLDHMQSFAPRSRQITTPVPHHSVFTGRMLFLSPNQQCQSTEG